MKSLGSLCGLGLAVAMSAIVLSGGKEFSLGCRQHKDYPSKVPMASVNDPLRLSVGNDGLLAFDDGRRANSAAPRIGEGFLDQLKFRPMAVLGSAMADMLMVSRSSEVIKAMGRIK